ncbi:integumentary mucin C.1-like [Saccostrea cucullata]|uniref:integumentary mucin C.1-like n=1 Tax=Saccostrea cuccullata TaxID=36930 RepID=UPI002ED1ADA8
MREGKPSFRDYSAVKNEFLNVTLPFFQVTTTTSVPSPTVNPLSTSGCHYHTDCSGHICSSDKHPYCKFDEYSTICHCTVCTEHKHCICPEGLIGLCYFDIEHKNYSCSCRLAPDTTTTVSKSSTSKSVPTTTLQSISVSSKSTTNYTPIPTTTQSSTVSSTTTSKSTTRIVSTASSSSVSSSTSAASPTSNSAISPTSTSVPSTNPGTPCPSCDDDLNCVWNTTCSTSQCCMARSPDHGFRFTVHCVQREDCRYMKTTSGNAEIYCCDDRDCLRKFVGI